MVPIGGIYVSYQGVDCEPCWVMLEEFIVGRMIDANGIFWVVVVFLSYCKVIGLDMGCKIV